MIKVLGEEVLRKAIQGELQASKFYSDVSKLIVNKKSKTLMESLSNEEARHKSILEKRYKELYNKDFEEIPGFVFDPNLKLEKFGLNSKSNAIEILSAAIEAENNAIKFYFELLQAVESNEDKDLLHSLIEFENSHKQKLQNEYNDINREFIWNIP
ncbi:MAG: ferritin family protein [Caldisericia bacterium]|jgi:rubrerythrin|nr:ferritin family protein [Caldisericia bacterium]